MPNASKEVPKLISQSVHASDRPLATRDLPGLPGMPKLEKAKLNAVVERLVANGTIHAWSSYRLWKEPEFDYFLTQGRELVRERPLWKSAMVTKLTKEGWGTTEEIAKRVFETLKALPQTHTWPRHKTLRGDAICFQEVDLSFYLGDMTGEFGAVVRKLEQIGIEPLETARRVCGDFFPEPTPVAEPKEAPQLEPQPGKALVPETNEKPTRTPIALPEPDSESERDFHRDITLELVFAWQDAETKEARKSLERVMFNVGIRELGTVGERVEFNGIYHDTNDDLFPDEPASIVQPGWQVRRGGKTRVLAKAMVQAEAEEDSSETP